MGGLSLVFPLKNLFMFQDLLAPLCTLNASRAVRFNCVDPLGSLPLPRDNPVVTRCLAECTCNASDIYGLCAHHDVPPADVPEFGQPWCTVLTSSCLDSLNAPPITVSGMHRGSCTTPNRLSFAIHKLAASPLDATTGIPAYQAIDIGGGASRTLLVNPVIEPFPNGTHRQGTLHDVFLDYERCFFANSVPTAVDRQRVCELLLASRTTGPSTTGAAKIDFALGNVSYGVFVSRRSLVSYIALRSDNLESFHVVYGTTGGGYQHGTKGPYVAILYPKNWNSDSIRREQSFPATPCCSYSHSLQFPTRTAARQPFAMTMPSPITRSTL